MRVHTSTCDKSEQIWLFFYDERANDAPILPPACTGVNATQKNLFKWIMLLAVTAVCLNAAGLVKAPHPDRLDAHRAGPGQVEVHDKETDVFLCR